MADKLNDKQICAIRGLILYHLNCIEALFQEGVHTTLVIAESQDLTKCVLYTMESNESPLIQAISKVCDLDDGEMINDTAKVYATKI